MEPESLHPLPRQAEFAEAVQTMEGLNERDKNDDEEGSDHKGHFNVHATPTTYLYEL